MTGETGCQLDLVNEETGVKLQLEIDHLKGSMFRVRIREKDPLRPRYEVEGALIGEPEKAE